MSADGGVRLAALVQLSNFSKNSGMSARNNTVEQAKGGQECPPSKTNYKVYFLISL